MFSNKDLIFTSSFWTELFCLSKVMLRLPPKDRWAIGGHQSHPRWLPMIPHRRSTSELAVEAVLSRVLLQLVLPNVMESNSIRGSIWLATTVPGFLPARSCLGCSIRQTANGQGRALGSCTQLVSLGQNVSKEGHDAYQRELSCNTQHPKSAYMA